MEEEYVFNKDLMQILLNLHVNYKILFSHLRFGAL